ncbi:MAG: amino acid racemase [Bacillota bacterium]|nr:amino acid racemase [Bacillota bacterium]
MWRGEEKILGVIGGMGPLATQLFYRQVIDKTEAECDQDHVNMILLNHASMPDRTQAILSGEGEKVFQLLLADARWLEENGAAAIAIPCNTSHLFAERLQEELEIPLVNMVKEAAAAVAAGPRKVRKVGILATDGTVQSGLYQRACQAVGLEWAVPSPEAQALVMKIIYDGIKGGKPIDYNDFIAIEGELAAGGCKGAILACTELSVFKELYHLPDFYTDAMETLAERSIEACGKRVKSSSQETAPGRKV